MNERSLEGQLLSHFQRTIKEYLQKVFDQEVERIMKELDSKKNEFISGLVIKAFHDLDISTHQNKIIIELTRKDI